MALLRHVHLPYSVASDEKLLETSRGLGTGGPAASRHRCQQRARWGESKEHGSTDACLCQKVVRNSFQTCFWSWITIMSSKIGVLTAVFEKLRFTYFHWTEVVLIH